jgi:adenine deaminase
MRVMLRYGSAWHDVAAQLPAINALGLDPRHFILCTDDSHSETLVREGHMDRVLRHAIGEGLDPVAAVQMATLNTAEHFGVSRDMGQIAPGRYADMLLVNDLRDFRPQTVIVRGKTAAEDGRLLLDMPSTTYPEWAMHSIHLLRPAAAADFRLDARMRGEEVTAHVIGVIENQAPTRHLVLKMQAQDGHVAADIPRDIAKVAVLDRHHASGSVRVGLVQGFGFRARCAVASTVAHDCHQIIVAGTDDAMMAQAVNELAECDGGQVVVKDGMVIGKVALPIAGLMSNLPAPGVAEAAGTVLAGFRKCGCTLNNPNMQLSLLGLVVIPELRLSDLGLIDVQRFNIIRVFD